MKCDVLMKQFNDQKKYQQSIDVFEKFLKEKTLAKMSPFVINQALRALIELKQYQRAMEIKQHLPQSLIDNDFVRYQFIRLYCRTLKWEKFQMKIFGTEFQ